MNNLQKHQLLVDRYRESARLIKQWSALGALVQVCLIVCINGWKYGEISYYTAGVPCLFAASIYFLIKDFRAILMIEKDTAHTIIEGLELERKNAVLGKFFHNVLQSFNFTRILVARSLVNVLALGCLGYLIAQFINDVATGFVVNRWMIGLFIWAPSILAFKLYHDSLKILDKAKTKTVAG